MSAPWRSAVRHAHGLRPRVRTEWPTCVAANCDAIRVARGNKSGRCLRHLPNLSAREDALGSMVRTVHVSDIADHIIVDLRGTTFDQRLLDETLQTLKRLRKDGLRLAATSAAVFSPARRLYRRGVRRRLSS